MEDIKEETLVEEKIEATEEVEKVESTEDVEKVEPTEEVENGENYYEYEILEHNGYIINYLICGFINYHSC